MFYIIFAFMKIKLILTGKTAKSYISTGMEEYKKRVQHYIGFEIIELDAGKQAAGDAIQMKKAEARVQLKSIDDSDFLILLDEKGKNPDSVEFSGLLQQKMNESRKCVVFLVGGAYGFTEEVYARANYKLSLSALTFSHQIVRLVFMEQLYRAMTILKGEPYHHV